MLEYICERANAASHAEIASALSIPKGSLSKLLRTMIARRYVMLDERTALYSVGEGITSLYERTQQLRQGPALSHPILEWMTTEVREASSYNVFRQDCIERIYGVESEQALGYRMTGNTRFTLYSSAAGKAVLSALPPDELERYLASFDLAPRTATTVRSIDELRKQVTQAAKDGAAVSHMEHTPGVVSVASVVRRLDSYPLGALNFVIPEVRFNSEVEAHCRRVLKTAVARLEKALHQVTTQPFQQEAMR